MKGREFNDLRIIMGNLYTSDFRRIPEKFRSFIESNMDPDYTSTVRTDIPIEDQDLSEETRSMLSALYITYLCRNAQDRREMVDSMNENELRSLGEEARPMTEEEYQAFLSSFDDWNTFFGPIPFWGESRKWCPQVCYEMTDSPEDPEIEVWEDGHRYGLNRVILTEDQRAQIVREAQEWVMLAETKETRTLYWHDDDYSEWHTSRQIDDFYEKHAVVRDGHFYGALILSKDTSSMGLSVYNSENRGVICIDGKQYGQTYEYFSHSSDEIEVTKETRFSLKRREEMTDNN